MAPEPKELYNGGLVFNGENYGYWNDCTRVHIMPYFKEVWDIVLDDPFTAMRKVMQNQKCKFFLIQ